MKPLNIPVHIPSKSDIIPSRCSLTEISDIVSECRSSETVRKETSPQMKLQEKKRPKLLQVCAVGWCRATGVRAASSSGLGIGVWAGPAPTSASNPNPRGTWSPGGREGRWAGPRNTWEIAPQSHFSSFRYLLSAHPQLLSVPQ